MIVLIKYILGVFNICPIVWDSILCSIIFLLLFVCYIWVRIRWGRYLSPNVVQILAIIWLIIGWLKIYYFQLLISINGGVIPKILFNVVGLQDMFFNLKITFFPRLDFAGALGSCPNPTQSQQGLDIYQDLFSSSEGYSSPETTPCPSPILNAVNTQVELLPVRPSGPLAELMFQIMDHYGFTSHGEVSRAPTYLDSLRAQGKPRSAINAIASSELKGHKYIDNYTEVCHRLSQYGQQERIDFMEANNKWFTHMRNFNYKNSDFISWYTNNINNISNGNIKDD
jgi:hypothetical protein